MWWSKKPVNVLLISALTNKAWTIHLLLNSSMARECLLLWVLSWIRLKFLEDIIKAPVNLEWNKMFLFYHKEWLQVKKKSQKSIGDKCGQYLWVLVTRQQGRKGFTA